MLFTEQEGIQNAARRGRRISLQCCLCVLTQSVQEESPAKVVRSGLEAELVGAVQKAERVPVWLPRLRIDARFLKPGAGQHQ